MDKDFYIELAQELFKADTAVLDHCLATDCSDCKYHYTISTECVYFFIAEYIIEKFQHRFKSIREKTIEEYRNKIVQCCRVVGGCDFEDLARIEKEILYGANDKKS